ncbi:DUF3068 domain-containing protein [Corynebacterium heidelbergense]|uniref:DUF3068 domain-containing protein n=1 Tax=Corynebacterium heidelbergense TaxID=2055947 RepID=A0A364V6F4_9CORY|nr:DUF3068 domain-containing protein [Corynebacterium heidelbergense]RAV32225.1 DUF3068 domain-containing protein [Corynebacterium heidelbergense]
MRSTTTAGSKRRPSPFIAIFLGVAALVLALALPAYVVPAWRVLPLNLMMSNSTAPTRSTWLDSAALEANAPVPGAAGRPECQGANKPLDCFIRTDAMLQSRSYTVAQQPSDSKTVTIEVGDQLSDPSSKRDADGSVSPVAATVDHVTLDRETQMPVPDPVSTLKLYPPARKAGAVESVSPFVRDGVQYQFPMGTDRASYPFYDIHTLESNPIEFVGELQRDGEKIYRFEQTVGPTELYPRVQAMLNADGTLDGSDKAVLSSLKMTMPARSWGLGSGDNDVQMSRYYTVHRVLFVEPSTGVVVDSFSDTWMFYARDDQDARNLAQPDSRRSELAHPTRTALHFAAGWDEASKRDHMARAKEQIRSTRILGVIAPAICGALGAALLLAGLWLLRRQAKKSAAEPRPPIAG